MAFAALDISTSLKSPDIQDLKRANKYVKKLKYSDVDLKFPMIGPIKSSRLIVYTDASLGNKEGSKSQGGHIIFIEGSMFWEPVN